MASAPASAATVAPAQEQATAALGERGVEVGQRVEQERQAVGAGEGAAQDGVVEHEQRHDPLGLLDGRRQRRVVVDAEVAVEQDDGAPHQGATP
jgi:hypothetical protein